MLTDTAICPVGDFARGAGVLAGQRAKDISGVLGEILTQPLNFNDAHTSTTAAASAEVAITHLKVTKHY
jgi:hypothetical protein